MNRTPQNRVAIPHSSIGFLLKTIYKIESNAYYSTKSIFE